MESHECYARCHSLKSIARKNNGLRGHFGSRCVSVPTKTRYPRKHTSACLASRRKYEEWDEEQNDKTVCRYNSRFALAKKLHAENLQHQPLPDKVDDRIFRREKFARESCPNVVNQDHAKASGYRFPKTSRLGYKKPKTKMDLAICWETPIDPVYEPHRPAHLDSTKDGLAPAIFALIQHTPAPKNRELLARLPEAEKNECDCARRQIDSKMKNRCCCDCLCDGMKSVTVAEARESELPRVEKPKLNFVSPRITERKCAACKTVERDAERKRRSDPRLIRSTVDIALGTERKNDDVRKNELSSAKITVPRPRTPFARRSFCIDTLAPPFSVIDSCRDGDYPEHWRLMSVYQQSYRNPQRRKTHHL